MPSFQIEDDDSGHREPSMFEKLCGSIIVAICVAPILLLGACFLLGWNEQQTVCTERLIIQGEANAHALKCDAGSKEQNGNLIFASCPITDGGKKLESGSVFEKFKVFNHSPELKDKRFLGIDVQVEQLQCIETERKEEKKDKNGKVVSSTTTYSYTAEWRKTAAATFKNANYKSHDAFKNACGSRKNSAEFPPTEVPTGSAHVEKMKVGNFEVGKEACDKITADTKVDFKAKNSNLKSYSVSASGGYLVKGSTTMDKIDDIRISVKTHAQGEKKMTILGKNNNGVIEGWTAPKSWLCAELDMKQYRWGEMTKDDLFKALMTEKNTLMWVLRILGFLLMWFALTRFFGPLEVMAECVPCIGPMLGDFVEAVVCVLTCPPACGCCLCVAGIVWVAMRPLVGIPMMIIWCCCIAGMVGAKIHMKNQKMAQDLEQGS